MKPIVTIFAASALLLGCADSPVAPTADDFTPAFAATTTTTNLQVPLNAAVFIPCALGGAGEVAVLSGTLHILIHVTVNNAGGITIKQHFQPQNVGGIGLTSGDSYRGNGVTQQTQTIGAGGLPFEFTFVNNFRIIGQGPGNNFMVHNTVHVTIDANGNARANVNNTSITCK